MSEKVLGRPTKLTPELQAEIVADIESNIPFKIAAEAAGIREETIYAWLNTAMADIDAENFDTIHVAFSKAIKKAIRNRVNRNLNKVDTGEAGWQSAAWLLERHPFSRKQFAVNADQFEQLEAKVSEMEAKMGVTNNG